MNPSRLLKVAAAIVGTLLSVVGDAPLVGTTSASLSRTVCQNEVLNLPLVNRDLYSLLSLTGGVTSNDTANSLGDPEQTTTINGGKSAQIRLEATNVLNVVNLQNPGTNLNAPILFGKICAARDMRRIQLGARLSF